MVGAARVHAPRDSAPAASVSIAHTHTYTIQYIEEGFMQKKKEKVVSAVWGAELFNSLPR